MPIKKVILETKMSKAVHEHNRRPKHLMAGPETKYPIVIDDKTTIYTDDKKKIPGIIKKWKNRII